MSFGFSIGDIIILTQLTTRAYNGWKNACGDYAGITCDLAVLQTLLLRIQAEVEAPNSLFAQHPDDIRGWETISKSCRSVVKELEDIVKKYKSLSTSRRKNWDKIRMGNENLDDLNAQLVKRIASLAAFASVLGISSQGRLENEAFPKLLQKVDGIAAQLRKGNGTVSTALSAYENDDKQVWREFRRDMIGAGIRSSEIRRYSPALKTYITRLQREGLLDEEVPLTPNEEKIVEAKQEGSSHSSGEESANSDEDEPQKNLPTSQTPPDTQPKTDEESAREKVEIMKKLHGPEHMDTLAAINELTDVYWNQGRWKEAEVMYRQNTETHIKVLGPEHPETLNTMFDLGIALLCLNRLEEAEKNQRDLMQTQSRVLGAEHRNTLKTMSSLAEVYMDQKRLDKAQKLARKALGAHKRVLGEKHHNTLDIMDLLAEVYFGKGQFSRAEELAKLTIASKKEVLGAEHYQTLESMELLSSVYENQGRLQEAEELWQQAFEGHKRCSGVDHHVTLSAMHELARIIRAQGRNHEAISLLEECLQLQEKLPVYLQKYRETYLKDINKWRDEEKSSKKRIFASQRRYARRRYASQRGKA
jgi:tetratricopeptide (TPR) repeat protein